MFIFLFYLFIAISMFTMLHKKKKTAQQYSKAYKSKEKQSTK